MPISLRLEKGIEGRIVQATKMLHTTKTEVIKRAVQKYLSELSGAEVGLCLTQSRKGAEKGFNPEGFTLRLGGLSEQANGREAGFCYSVRSRTILHNFNKVVH